MAYVEAYWDCPYCGNKAIRGREKTCPSCGKTRSASTKFYMLDTKPVADDTAVEAGADWLCPYCDSYNPQSETACKNCGHPREASDKDYFEVREDEERKQEKKDAEVEAITQTGSGSASGGVRRSFGPGRIIGIALVLAVLVSCLCLFLPRSAAVTVVDKAWERSVAVEELRLVNENDWVLPTDAVELIKTAQEVHHYDQVLDHYEVIEETRSRQVQDGYDTYTTYEDMGNGYYETVEHSEPRYVTEYYTETYEEPVYRSVPRYETKYYYTIYRWVYDRTETTSGTDDPYWPEIPDAEDVRAGDRSEQYSVLCENRKGKQFDYGCEYDIWSALDIGRSYEITVRSDQIIEIQ